MLGCEQRIFVDGGKGGSIRIRSAIPTLPLLDPDAARSRAVRRNASMPMVLRSGVIFTPDSPGGARRLSHSGFSHVLLSRAYLADRDGDASTYCQHCSGYDQASPEVSSRIADYANHIRSKESPRLPKELINAIPAAAAVPLKSAVDVAQNGPIMENADSSARLRNTI